MVAGWENKRPPQPLAPPMVVLDRLSLASRPAGIWCGALSAGRALGQAATSGNLVARACSTLGAAVAGQADVAGAPARACRASGAH